MGEAYQSKWMDVLPFILLGKKVAFQPDLGASASELAFGKNLVIPGQLLHDPGQLPDGPTLQNLLQDVRNKTNRSAVQSSNHSPPEKTYKEIPLDVTQVYVRQHQKTGLQTPFEGPFKIAERLSRSTFKIEVGLYKSGEKRYEVRHANDLKFAHPDSPAAPIHRSPLGRPPTSATEPQLKPSL